jgi:hypothetical protein
VFKFAKRLILFLELQEHRSASFQEILSAFDSEVEAKKAIDDALEKLWIIKLGSDEYKLATTGIQELSKMTKP